AFGGVGLGGLAVLAGGCHASFARWCRGLAWLGWIERGPCPPPCPHLHTCAAATAARTTRESSAGSRSLTAPYIRRAVTVTNKNGVIKIQVRTARRRSRTNP